MRTTTSSLPASPQALLWTARTVTRCSAACQTKLAAEGKAAHAVLCHRLDTGTSGLVLLAKNSAAEAFLTAAIKARDIEKRYLCVTFGRPNPPAALLRDYLLKDAERGIVRITDTTAGGAKEVITGYETLAVSGRLACWRSSL